MAHVSSGASHHYPGAGHHKGRSELRAAIREIYGAYFCFLQTLKCPHERYFSSIVFENKTESQKDFKQNNESALHLTET